MKSDTRMDHKRNLNSFLFFNEQFFYLIKIYEYVEYKSKFFSKSKYFKVKSTFNISVNFYLFIF